MSKAACEMWNREIQWSDDRWASEESGRWTMLGSEILPPTRVPTASYSKRANLLAELRSQKAWATTNADEEIRPPSEAAAEAAKDFINNLPDGCLTIRLAISQGGEINFFAGATQRLLQIFIDETGEISYYGKHDGGVMADDSIAVNDFPYMQLFRFV